MIKRMSNTKSKKKESAYKGRRGRPKLPRTEENGFNPFNNSSLHVFLPPHKLEIVNHKAKHKTIGGAKDSGKTYIAVLKAIANLEENSHAYVLAARKYKLSAADKFHTIFSNIIMEIRLNGFDILDYKKNVNKSVKMLYKDNSQYNQSIEYVSFEDENGISGAEAPNLGYYSDFIADEPVLKDDSGKTPSRKEWDSTMAVVADTISRSKRKHEKAYKTTVPETTYWYLFNLWDEDHPKVEDLDRHIPEEIFLAFVVGTKNIMSKSNEWIEENWNQIWASIKKNHTMCVYNQAIDELFVKTTKLSNPDNLAVADSLEKEYKFAIMSKNSLELARLLGMIYEGSSIIQHTYDLRQVELADTKLKLVNEKYDSISISLGWDIDINEKLVCTPTVVAQKIDSNYELEEKLFVLPIITVPAYGVGAIGSKNIEIYEKALITTTNEVIYEIKSIFKFKSPILGVHVSVDDDKQTWISHIYEEIKNCHHEVIFSRAKKHKIALGKGQSWDIPTRTDVLQQMIDLKYIIFDKKNVNLLSELKKSTLNASATKRDESSFRHKNYNYINSLEYAIKIFANRHLFIKKRRGLFINV